MRGEQAAYRVRQLELTDSISLATNMPDSIYTRCSQWLSVHPSNARPTAAVCSTDAQIVFPPPRGQIRVQLFVSLSERITQIARRDSTRAVVEHYHV